MILNNLTSEGMNFSLPKKINSKGVGATCYLQRQSGIGKYGGPGPH